MDEDARLLLVVYSERPMKVAFDAGPWLNVRTGVGRYARELAAYLPVFGVDIVPYAVALRGPTDSAVARWRLPAKLVQSAWRRLDRPSIARLTGPIDVVHATNFVLPALGGALGVVTVHDLSFYRDDAFPGGERLRDLVPWSVARAACVIAPTAVVADEIVATYGVPRERVHAIHEGVSPVFFGAAPLADTALEAMGIRRPYAIAVGALEPRKNLRRLLEAWTAARRELAGWTLVLAGPPGWGPELPPAPGVVPIGWVGDETLPGLLAGAEVFCYPSTYEGFGLPPLEAMAAGTPALVGRYEAAWEVLGDAALLVDPADSEAISLQLTRLAADDDLRRRTARAGRARAASFTWERTARATADAYRSVLDDRRPARQPRRT
jgi:glycosyltransferase involved in cell wall biosynthesis